MSPLVASQIAAGEVVERPASVVKELVENAIDAGAARITIDLEQGGIELIRVIDDGAGIPDTELPLALTPHATSKISATEDLDRIATMGFRGEALASIASVARVTLRSRTAAQPAGAELAAEGHTLAAPRPAPGPIGTSVTVRNLFFNTPARRKFLRTPSTEQGRCLDAVRQLALSHPALAFRVTSDGRTVLDVPPGQSSLARCLEILGAELAPELIEFSSDPAAASILEPRADISLWGVAGRPALARATAAGQFIFVNGRCIRDRTLQHAIREAYRGLIDPGRYPTCVVMLDLPPSAVDVNVHPAKAEVRFRDSSAVHQRVLHAVRRALQSADLTPSVSGAWGASAHAAMLDRAVLGSGLNFESTEPKPLDRAGGINNHSTAARYVNPAAFVEGFRAAYGNGAQAAMPFGAPQRHADDLTPPRGPDTLANHLSGPDANPNGTFNTHETPRPGHELINAEPASGALQVHNSFLVTQDSVGILIIDQHALHERVMFEKLLARLERSSTDTPGGPGGSLESQRLLAPVVVEASPRQLEALLAITPMLRRLGIDAEPLTPTSVGVHAFATFLFERGVEVAPFIAELLDRAVDQSWDQPPAAGLRGAESALHEVLDMMACKAAIKAGDHLSDMELAELLALRQRIERSSNCPHGRPTSIRLSIQELERRFGRT
ncbi:DNA mismatch repair endonuclease MutL [soil metagenome]